MKRNLFIFIFSIIGILPCSKVIAQYVVNDTIVFSGQIVGENDDKPLPYANIINLSKNKGKLTNTNGYFMILIGRNDVLKITSIGYHDKYVCFKDSVNKKIFFNKVKLAKKVYNLTEVNIFAPLEWDEFKKEFVNKKIPKDDIQKIKDKILTSLNTPEALTLLAKSTQIGIIIPLNFKSKDEKQIKTINQLKAEIKLNEANTERIRILTGLKGEEIRKFEIYCNFSYNYLLTNSDYLIILRTKELWEKYKILNNIK